MASSDTRCGECGSSIGASPAAALFSMSNSGGSNDDFQADVPTEVGPYLAQAMADFAEEPDTIVATTTYLLYSIKRTYGPGEPISLLAYDPESTGKKVTIGLFAASKQIASEAVELNNAGAGIATFDGVAHGQLEARFTDSAADAIGRFVVLEKWPGGLQASVVDLRITGNPAQRWIALALQVGLSGEPYNGTVSVELLDRDNVVSQGHVRVADGEAHCNLAAGGHSPHTLHISDTSRDQMVSVPLDWSIHPIELSPTSGTALSLYPINGAWHKDGLYVLNGAGAELPDLGNQLSPTIESAAHCSRGQTVVARVDAGVGAPASALVVVRAARARGLHTPGRTIAAQALAQLDTTPGAPPTGIEISCPPFERGSVIYSGLHATDSSGRLAVDVPTDKPGDWVIDTFIMTDLGWGEAEARVRVTE